MATREASDLLAVTPSRSGSPRQAAETLASARPTARRKWRDQQCTHRQTQHGSREEEEQPIESSAMRQCAGGGKEGNEKSLEIMLRFLDKIEKETALEHSSTDVDEKEMYL
ncbi:hypothetical protein OsI_16102 [Oryza sativa Indica Group]|uniref:Uncharacterized protein n=1 Tax=Oryza sativa subsp. indica TaxID=39946 RepID=A2XU24_ORYSI|nr:hypothetical protein OsI_16102 [Oryza sativa Indica Group]